MTVNNDVSKDSPICYKNFLSLTIGYIDTDIVYTSRVIFAFNASQFLSYSLFEGNIRRQSCQGYIWRKVCDISDR